MKIKQNKVCFFVVVFFSEHQYLFKSIQIYNINQNPLERSTPGSQVVCSAKVNIHFSLKLRQYITTYSVFNKISLHPYKEAITAQPNNMGAGQGEQEGCYWFMVTHKLSEVVVPARCLQSTQVREKAPNMSHTERKTGKQALLFFVLCFFSLSSNSSLIFFKTNHAHTTLVTLSQITTVRFLLSLRTKGQMRNM